jgi:hypothetical protein
MDSGELKSNSEQMGADKPNRKNSNKENEMNKGNIKYVTVEKIVKVPVEKQVTKYIVIDRPIEVFTDRIVNRYVDKIVEVDRPV